MDADKRTTENQLMSPFIRLPAELRNRIYEFTFHDTTVKVHERRKRYGKLHREKYQPSCGLIFVCRQIRHEALPILYGASTFDLTLVWRGLSESHIMLLDEKTRRNVCSIKVDREEMEKYYSRWYTAMYELRDPSLFEEPFLETAFPALRHVHISTWELDDDLAYFTLPLLATAMFGREDIEVHAPLDEDSLLL